MHKPIVCLSGQLCQFLIAFRHCFTKRQWRYFVIVLLGLVECEERRTMTGLLRTVGERVSLSGLSRFLNKWPWSPDKLADVWCQRCPLTTRIYRQEAVCQREGVPFVSKVDMVIQQIQNFEPAPDTHTHVLIDSWYHCRRVRRAAQARGWDVSGGLKSNRTMRLIAADGSRTWQTVSQSAAHLSAEDWQEVIWPSNQGGQTMYAHLIQTWIRKLGPTLLLITCHDPAEPLKTVWYWGSTVMDLDAQAMVNVLAKRWEIETFFENDCGTFHAPDRDGHCSAMRRGMCIR